MSINQRLRMPARLLLDSRGVDVTMSYNTICASCILLEVLIFQESCKCVTGFRHPYEHKTLKPDKSLHSLAENFPHDGLSNDR